MARKKKKVLPKFLCHLPALELVHGPPDCILSVSHLRPYQKWMERQIKALPGILLGAEMGLGKTAAVLKAVSDEHRENPDLKVLIVAPLHVAENTWSEEIAKWDFARHLTYRICTGTEPQRKASFIEPVTITIINRENLKWLMEWISPHKWPFDWLVYDEVSRLKRGMKRTNPKQRADGTTPPKGLTELGVINRVRQRIKKFIGLSGTPTPNGLIDLYGPMYAVDSGDRLGSSMTAYQNRWFRQNTWTRTWEPFDHSEKEIMGLVSDRFFSLREEDYLNLPPLIEVDHKVVLPPAVMQRYREFEKEAAIDIVNRWGDDEVIEAVNRGVLTNKLLQFANGSLYENAKFDEDTDSWLPRNAVKVHDEKIKRLESIISEANGKPVLVAYSFQFDKELIKKKFPQCKVFGEKGTDKRDWDAGRIPMMLLHPASAGHGLNFQSSSNIAVWYGLTWSHELYQQFVKRLHRSGQKQDRVFLHRIIAENTADELLLPVLRNRKATEDRIKATVKARLDQIVEEHRMAA